jgi:hypothetical protein
MKNPALAGGVEQSWSRRPGWDTGQPRKRLAGYPAPSNMSPERAADLNVFSIGRCHAAVTKYSPRTPTVKHINRAHDPISLLERSEENILRAWRQNEEVCRARG